MNRIRIVFADDHPIFARGLRQILAEDPCLEVVAEARDGEAALASIEQHAPDVVILDIDMPKKDGFEVVRAMQQKGLCAAVAFLTMHKNEALFNGALDLGVRGYVLKDSAMEDAVDCAKAVAAGNHYVSPVLATFLFGRHERGDSSVAHPSSPSGLNKLTATERQVLHLVSRCKSTSEIAEELFVSPRTIESHRANICSKLNLQGRDALLRFAVGSAIHLPGADSLVM